MPRAPFHIGNEVWYWPSFVHEFGNSAHHTSMIRTSDLDEYGAPIPGTGPSDGRYAVHKFLDAWIFYPLMHWLKDWVGDNEIYYLLRTILGFFWGLNCGFPPRDVALYTVWYLRGCCPTIVKVKP